MSHDNVNGKVNGDLISRKDAKFLIKQTAKQIAKQNGVDHTTYALKIVYDDMDTIPAIDAVPVVHARWVYYNGYVIPNCSACGCSITDIEWAFCPHCGAMLDESSETK